MRSWSPDIKYIKDILSLQTTCSLACQRHGLNTNTLVGGVQYGVQQVLKPRDLIEYFE